MVSQRRIVAASHVVDDAQRRLARTDTARRLLVPEAADLRLTAVMRVAVVVVVVMVMVMVVPPVTGARRRAGPRLLRLLELGVVRRRGRRVVLVAPQVAPCHAVAA